MPEHDRPQVTTNGERLAMYRLTMGGGATDEDLRILGLGGKLHLVPSPELVPGTQVEADGTVQPPDQPKRPIAPTEG